MRTPSRRYRGASAADDIATWPCRRRAETGRGGAGHAGERHAPTEAIAEERRTTSEGVTMRAETTAGIGGARGSASGGDRCETHRRCRRGARRDKVRSWHIIVFGITVGRLARASSSPRASHTDARVPRHLRRSPWRPDRPPSGRSSRKSAPATKARGDPRPARLLRNAAGFPSPRSDLTGSSPPPRFPPRRLSVHGHLRSPRRALQGHLPRRPGRGEEGGRRRAQAARRPGARSRRSRPVRDSPRASLARFSDAPRVPSPLPLPSPRAATSRASRSSASPRW